MFNPNALEALFDFNPATVALGEMIAAAREIEDQAMEECILEDLTETTNEVLHLEACFALEL